MRVFIGSSSEQRRLVEWLTSFILSEYAGKIEAVPWTMPWTGGQYTLENLLRFVDETDASILFWTADDKTWYRDTERHEPRDNLVFEAGLFIAAHGRERAQLMIPRYEPGDPRASVATPSDVAGMTWNQYQWKDGPAEGTGLPLTARTVCDYLATLKPRPRKSPALLNLAGRDNVEDVRTFVGDWATINTDGIAHLASDPAARFADLLAVYNAGEMGRKLNEVNFRQRKNAELRACFANMWDEELLRAYQRKFYDRTGDQIRNTLKESIQRLLGQGEVEAASATDIRVTGINKPLKAKYEIRLTGQRITYGYYRVDDVAFIVPLDMKKAQDPAPFAWVLERTTAPRAFQHYLDEFQKMFAEAQLIYPGK